ncbi:MAG: hypothetical protein AAGC78_05650 [Cellvibrio sp.]|uniref:hypothetical protein n=1 Tax=Cellvibrio sp. TaxID=1965322 RepID=UPI0031A2EF8A
MQGDNIYAPPESELQQPLPDTGSQEFYVVSKSKFSILYFLTFGIYALYWHYKNWTQYRRKHNESCFPVMRAIFSIFFTHSLFSEIRYRLKVNHPDVSWSSGAWATMVVIVVIAERATEKLPSELLSSFLPFVCYIAHGLMLLKVQSLINLACDDIDGVSNSRFSILNYLWAGLIPVIILYYALESAELLNF